MSEFRKDLLIVGLIVIFLILFLAFCARGEELNLNPVFLEPGQTCNKELIGLEVEEWKKVLEEIETLREVNVLKTKQLENLNKVHIFNQELLESKDERIKLYISNNDLLKEDISLYREELDKSQKKYLTALKWNSYKTGFSFTLGITTALLAGWIFNEIAE